MLRLHASDLSWINGQADDPLDPCAHGRVELSLDGVTLHRTGQGDVTLSACLYLLRTVEDDHTEASSVAKGNWLFPCCGFPLVPGSGRYRVDCMGCNTGTDVFVRHAGPEVELSVDGRSVRTTAREWAAAVLALVDQVERFYAACTPKCPPGDDMDAAMWQVFWSEWESRKARAREAMA